MAGDKAVVGTGQRKEGLGKWRENPNIFFKAKIRGLALNSF